MSLGVCLGHMQDMGMNFKHPATVSRPQILRYLVLNSSKSKFHLKLMNLACYNGAASTCRGKIFVPFGAGLGICFSQTRASQNKCDGFGRERATFGDETISVASYCMLRYHSRNGNECQTPCHRHSAANIEIPGF